MNSFRSLRLAFCAAVIVPAVICGDSLAATTSVQLRVEGSSKTFFEGPVTTGPETIQTPSSKGSHPCNYLENGGVNAGTVGAVGGPTTALHDAALAAGLEFDATWFGEEGKPGDFFITQVGSDKDESTPPYDSWGLAVNYKSSEVGGCEVAVEPGVEVLWAYNFFNLTHLLRISGPASVQAGSPFTVHVVDGQNGEAISGASVGEDTAGLTGTLPGSAPTDASGNASLTLTHAGTFTLKASRSDSVRSNGLVVCVHNPGETACGSAPTGSTGSGVAGYKAASTPYKGPYALVAAVTSVLDGHHYPRGRAPRVLAGTIHAHSGVTSVSLTLRRSYRGRCWAYDGLREEFLKARCATGKPFQASAAAGFSYLLPAALAPGRYVLDVTARDVAGNTVALARGTSRLVFYVG